MIGGVPILDLVQSGALVALAILGTIQNRQIAYMHVDQNVAKKIMVRLSDQIHDLHERVRTLESGR